MEVQGIVTVGLTHVGPTPLTEQRPLHNTHPVRSLHRVPRPHVPLEASQACMCRTPPGSGRPCRVYTLTLNPRTLEH